MNGFALILALASMTESDKSVSISFPPYDLPVSAAAPGYGGDGE